MLGMIFEKRFQISGSRKNALDLIRRRYSVVEFDFPSQAAFPKAFPFHAFPFQSLCQAKSCIRLKC